MRAFMNASFAEKSVWITLVGLAGVFGFYFFVAARMLSAGVTVVAPFVPLFIFVVVGLVVAMTIGHAVVALASPVEDRDERDRLISWRAEHNSSWLLGVGVVAAIFALALPGIGRAWIANGLLLALLLSELLGQALQLYYYRRGM